MSEGYNPYQPPSTNVADAALDASDFTSAGPGRRFVTFLVDTAVFYLLVIVMALVVGIVLGATGEEAMLSESAGANCAWTILSWLFYAGYYVFFEGLLGRSPGKLLTGTRVVSTSGERLRFGQLVGRSFARLVPFEWFSIFFDDSHTMWHDRWSGTRVVRTNV